MTVPIRVRPAHPGEVALLTPLLYEVSPAAHDRFAGVCCYPVWEGPDRAAAYAGIGLHAAPFWRRPGMIHAR